MPHLKSLQAPKGHLSSSVLQYEEPVLMSEFEPARELIEFHSLAPGEYVIIPCTYDPNKTASFVITIYSKAEAEIE